MSEPNSIAPVQTNDTPVDELPAGATSPDRSSQYFLAFLIVAVCGLSALVVLLLLQNRDLKNQLAWKKRVEQTTATQSLAIGENVEALSLISAGGVAGKIEYGADKPATLVLFVSEHCGFCEQAIPLWARMLRDTKDSLASAKGPGIRIVGIVADALDDASLKQIAAEIPTYRVQDGHTTWLRRVNATPSAVLLSSTGKVENFWIGETSPSQIEELRLAVLEAAAR